MRLAAVAGVEELGEIQKQEAAHTLPVRNVQVTTLLHAAACRTALHAWCKHGTAPLSVQAG